MKHIIHEKQINFFLCCNIYQICKIFMEKTDVKDIWLNFVGLKAGKMCR